MHQRVIIAQPTRLHLLNNIRFILVETTHPGNIGAAARAMKTMCLSKLYLVKPTAAFPNAEATVRAAGADDILGNAHSFTSLDEALADCSLIIGTSARLRRLPVSLLNPQQCAQKAVAIAKQEQQVAIVFGREHAGLTNSELNHCHYHVYIPSNSDFSSLNLAAAVQIIAYEIKLNSLKKQTIQTWANDTLATYHEVQLFYQQLQQTLRDINFLKTDSPRKLMPRLQRLFNRAKLEKMELDLLMGIFKQINANMKKNNEK